jgi:hypothetical protein
MRANISNELLNAIDERIYLDLEIHIMTKKMNESDNEGFKNYLGKIINDLIKQRRELNTHLIKEGVKIYDVVEDDDKEFVEYPYSVKVNGGFKQGTMRYWRHALRFKLKNRMNKYFGGE